MTNEEVKDVVTISFIECLVKNEGWRISSSGTPYASEVWRVYKVWKETPAELWLVRPDGLRRAFSFRLGSIIFVGQSAVQFNQHDVIEELAIDESKQFPKKTRMDE